MSAHLVKHWKRLAQRWRDAAAALPPDDFAKRVDGFARADTYQQCARSLELSLKHAAGKRTRKGAA